MNFVKMLSGKKTYLLAFCGVVYAVAGYLSGNLDGQAAMTVIWASLSMSALRAGVAKVGA